MRYVLDTHTHTIVSGHAYSTMKEMIDAAREKGLQLLAITDHGPALQGSCDEVYYHNLRVIPRQYGDLEVMIGMEANIMDYEGHLDASPGTQKRVDYLIASLHKLTILPGTAEENTAAYIGAMHNPRVNTIGHIDDGKYPIDMERVVLESKKTGTLLELNSSSLHPGASRVNARENDIRMLELCKKHEVPIVLDSDAHISWDVANFDRAAALLEELNFPERLVANTSVAYFKELLQKKRDLFGLTA